MELVRSQAGCHVDVGRLQAQLHLCVRKLGSQSPHFPSFGYDDIPAPPPPPYVVPVIWDRDALKPDHGLALTLMSPLPVRYTGGWILLSE